MSDTMLLGVLRMPFGLAMATPTAQIQYHQRGVQAADEIEKLTRERDEARAEVDRLRAFEAAHKQLQAALDVATRERDEARARASKLWAVLEMVRDAVTCASTAAWEAAWAAARESTWTQSARVAREAAARAEAAVDAQVTEFRRVCREIDAGRDPYPLEAKP